MGFTSWAAFQGRGPSGRDRNGRRVLRQEGLHQSGGFATPYRWRTAKAERFLGDAEEALRTEMWETCVSRCYYAAYHLVASLLESGGGYSPRRWTHEELADSFRESVSKGLGFSSRDVDLLGTLSRERSAADYEHAGFSQERAEAAVAIARELCEPLMRHLAGT